MKYTKHQISEFGYLYEIPDNDYVSLVKLMDEDIWVLVNYKGIVLQEFKSVEEYEQTLKE